MHGHDARSRCTVTMHGHDARSRCTVTMHGHDARSPERQNCLEIVDKTVHSLMMDQ